jgi:hypothetical protein
MPLILAIEPDRRQAARITALAHDPLKAEIVVAESAERALAALSERLPDLILTSRLLSPKDEALVDGRLRELDAVGKHVQTLMIPMLASAKNGGRKDGGLLNRLRRSSDDGPSHGCDPEVFAAEVSEYLDRAVAERALTDRDHQDRDLEYPAPTPQVEPASPAADTGTAIDVISNDEKAEAAESKGAEPWQEVALEEKADEEAAAAEPDPVLVEFSDVDLWSALPTSQRTWPQVEGPSIAASASPEIAQPARTSEGTSKKRVTKPPNEEWGQFDPNRCGFGALLEELQDLAD